MIYSKVVETCNSPDTGEQSLGGASGAGNRSFVSAAGDGAAAIYFRRSVDGSVWELGWGVLNAGPPDSLTRNFIASSTGALIVWGTETTYIYSEPAAEIIGSLMRGNIGATRPDWLPAGGTWVKNSATPWILYLWDGAADHPLFSIDPATLQSTPYAYSGVDDATEGPVSDEYRDSASPADGDLVAARTQSGNSSTGVKRVLTKEWTRYDTVTNAAENAVRGISAMIAGALTQVIEFGKRIKLSRPLDMAKSASVTAASSTDIWNVTGNLVHVTGNTQIDDMVTSGLTPGASRTVIIDGAPLIKNGANLNLGGSDIQAAAGDILEVVADSATLVLLKTYTPAGAKTAGIPSGFEGYWSGTVAPSGWIMEYGQVLSQTVYAGIYAVVQNTYNTGGEGVGNFRMPDGRGYVFAGKDNMGGVAANRLTTGTGRVDGATLGAVGGEETHTLITAEMPAHTHTVGSTVDNQSGGGVGGNNLVKTGGTNVSTGSAGSGAAHNNVQPTTIRNVIMKI